MKVRARFFSRLRDAAGRAEMDVELDDGATLADLLRVLFEKFPQLAQWDAHLLLAIDLEYAARDHALRDGDEISIMPPVQGG